MQLQEYLITSPLTLSASIKCGYDPETGELVQVTFDNLSLKNRRNFGKVLPVNLEILNQVATEKNWKVQPLKMDLSFANFYEQYAYKHGKKRGEAKWKKMPDDQKAKALLHIPKYKNLLKLRPGQQPLYPESYMNAEPWND